MSPSSEFAIGRFPDRSEVVVTGPVGKDVARVLESGEADRLVLNYAHGFNEPNLEFLRELPVRELVIVDRRLTSLSPVLDLGDTLEMLHVTTHPSLLIDLERLPRLVDLSADWKQVEATIRSAKELRRLHLGRYSLRDLDPLAELQNLERLALTDRPRLWSLDGLGGLHRVHELLVSMGNELVDFSALRESPQLVDLDLEGCRGLADLEILSECRAVRRLNLADCGDIHSVAPLRHMGNIEVLLMYGNTLITDSDLTPISDLPRLKELRMRSRRQYKPSVPKIQETLPHA